MNKRQAYSKAYNQLKRPLRDAIKRYAETNPERFKELQAQALYELKHPPERPIICSSVRLQPSLLPHFDVDEFIRQHHTQSYYIRTKDAYGDIHAYFESLNNETPEEVLTRRHPKFAERNEEVTEVVKCECPLCIH